MVNWVLEQMPALLGQAWHDWGEVDGELSEEVESDGANFLESVGFIGIFGEDPRFGVFDEGVGLIGEFHDEAHGFGVVTGVVGLGDGFAGIGGALEEAAIVRVGGGESGLFDELGGPAGEVDDFVDQVGIDLGGKFFEVEIDIVEARAEFAGVVVAEGGGVEVLEVGRGFDEGPLAFGHFGPIDGEEAVDVDLGGEGEAGGFEHAGPEEGVEVGDIFADEVVDFGVG